MGNIFIFLLIFCLQPFLSFGLGRESGKSDFSPITSKNIHPRSSSNSFIFISELELDYKTAAEIASLPLECYNKEYPYKMGIVLNGAIDVQV